MSDLFLRACRGEPLPRPPLWLMRQAGRYLPEYRELRSRYDFLTLCSTPELAARVTLQPIERFGFDAAILFSDILIPAAPMGLRIGFEPGPVLDPPVRSAADVARLRVHEPRQSVPFVFDTIRLVRRELGQRAPLIGFAAAPFTLAAYVVEGRGSRQFETLRAMLAGEPATAARLLEAITRVTIDYLRAQIEAGVQAVQLFDTWAGLLSTEDYAEHALPWAHQVLAALADSGVPRIYFALDAAHLLEQLPGVGADVLGVDWRVSLDEAARRIGGRPILQGNLDPTSLLAPPDVVERRARRVIERGRTLRGHIYNLGHGVLPITPPEHVATLVRTVQQSATS
jgi:uroporphyrinogen decarboxylase